MKRVSFEMLVILTAVVATGCAQATCDHDTCLGPGPDFDIVIEVPHDAISTDIADTTAGRDADGDAVGPDSLDDVTGPTDVEYHSIDLAGISNDEFSCHACYLGTMCPAGWDCQPSFDNKLCLRPCNDDGDCKSGFLCTQTGASRYCRPLASECFACMGDEPCPAGKCCDFRGGQCTDCSAQCIPCFYDFECAAGLRCMDRWPDNETGVCVPECLDGVCPDSDNYSCQDTDGGVPICVPNPGQCPGCVGDTPYYYDHRCVQCLVNADCGEDSACDQETFECVKCEVGTIPGGDGECRQCWTNRDCEAAGIYDRGCESGMCTAELPCAGICSPFDPVCVLSDGGQTCVQCAHDSDCARSFVGCTCSGAPDFTCVDSQGADCVVPDGQCPAGCSVDTDCEPDAQGNPARCSVNGGDVRGFCFDDDGTCDGGFKSCCGPGMDCVSPSQILSDMFGTVPRIIDKPDVDLPKYCTCNTASDCLNGNPCTDTDIVCTSGPSGIQGLVDYVCTDGQLDDRFPQKMCMTPATLLGWFGITG